MSVAALSVATLSVGEGFTEKTTEPDAEAPAKENSEAEPSKDDPLPTLHSDPKMTEIIARVKRHEEQYRNLETIIRREQHFDPQKWTVPDTVERLHTIAQGDMMCFAEDEEQSLSSGETRQYRRASAYDGRTTTTVEYGNSANIHPGRYEPSQVFPPHTWGMFHLEVNFPLSIYLQGTAVLTKHPKARRFPVEHGAVYEFYKAESELAGEELVNDLKCIKIHVKRWYYTKDGPASEYLWLAPERNYLCVKSRATTNVEGIELPISESVASELREIKPGIWLPMQVQVEHYDYEALRQNQLVTAWTQRLVVERVAPDPQYPRRKFSVDDLPEGLPVYTIGMDGTLENSPQHPIRVGEARSTTLPDIIKRVRDSEQLHTSIDVSIESAYRKDRVPNTGTGGGLLEIYGYEVHNRTVISGAKQYGQEQRTNRMADGTQYAERTTAAFDGEWTRQVSENNRRDPNTFDVSWASLSKQRGDNMPVYRPHTMGLEKFEPLSQILASAWSNRRHRHRQSVEYEGDDTIDDLLCYRIRIDVLVGEDRRPYASRFLWLAKDRGLLPIRSEWREPAWNTTLPTGITILSGIREVAPSVWLPYRATSFAFRKSDPDGLCENRLIVNWVKDYQIQRLALNPWPDPDLFTTVRVPKGTKFGVIDENGDLIASLEQAEDGNLSLGDEEYLELRSQAKQKAEGK